MQFELDNQTIKDLELLGDGKLNDSIFSFYNRTKTLGGKACLLKLMENPLTDLEQLKRRSRLIKYIASIDLELQINSNQLDFIDAYTRLNIPSLRNNWVDAFFQHLSYRLKPQNDYYLIQASIQQLIYLIKEVKQLVGSEFHNAPKEFTQLIDELKLFITHKEIKAIDLDNDRIGFKNINRFDCIFRKKYKHELIRFIEIIYLLDVYISIGNVAKEECLAFVEYADSSTPSISIEALHHPLLPNAVPYDVQINESNNLCFLTGPNMAGKSTFLKSLGIAVYISHLGFPVPAKKMITSVYNGIITTLNLSDNMNRGYSHFYSEVKRVKKAAIKLKEKNRLFVIFDELFRGTNVKDAFDASLLIIESFAQINKSTFCVSTHITEVAEQLKQLKNIEYKYFDSKLVNGKPTYSYELKNGVSHERLGMHIVRNEDIVEILSSITKN
ncbi:hypothetical protein EMN47_17215 [Prolixibacteraceae bacterium JC049]|nr:hypothetical protein [Prolixibacteraceae bacterium JC049]